jgi:hypothetical protein
VNVLKRSAYLNLLLFRPGNQGEDDYDINHHRGDK